MNMKKQILLFVLFLQSLVSGAFSGEIEINSIKYFVVTKTKTAEVLAKNYSGDIVIPATVECENIVCSVTSIKDDAFSGCKSAHYNRTCRCDCCCCGTGSCDCKCCFDSYHYCQHCGKQIGKRNSCLELCPCIDTCC